jgi:hypothetical protein
MIDTSTQEYRELVGDLLDLAEFTGTRAMAIEATKLILDARAKAREMEERLQNPSDPTPPFGRTYP